MNGHPFCPEHATYQKSPQRREVLDLTANRVLSALVLNDVFPSLPTEMESFGGEVTSGQVKLLGRSNASNVDSIVINVKFPLQPREKYYITQCKELGFS